MVTSTQTDIQTDHAAMYVMCPTTATVIPSRNNCTTSQIMNPERLWTVCMTVIVPTLISLLPWSLTKVFNAVEIIHDIRQCRLSFTHKTLLHHSSTITYAQKSIVVRACVRAWVRACVKLSVSSLCSATTLCLKIRFPDIFSYNSSKNCLIFIIFGTYINKRLGNQRIVYFPTSPK